jgi:hypothetical protein
MTCSRSALRICCGEVLREQEYGVGGGCFDSHHEICPKQAGEPSRPGVL